MEFLIRINNARFPVVVDDAACVFKTSLLVPPTAQRVTASFPRVAEVFRYHDVSLFSPYCADAKEVGDFEALGPKDYLSLFQESEPFWFVAVMPAKDGAWLLELGTVEKSCLDLKIMRLSPAEASGFYPVLRDAICKVAERSYESSPVVGETASTQAVVVVLDVPPVSPRKFRLPPAPEPLFIPDFSDDEPAEGTEEKGGES